MTRKIIKGNSPVITLRLSAEWVTQLDGLAEALNVSRAKIIKEAIFNYMCDRIKDEQPNKE